MLVRLTGKNRITLPKAILDTVPAAAYFQVEAEGGRIILTPVSISPIDAVRRKLAELGISEKDIEDAVQWARNKGGKTVTLQA